ncbi:MAG TPA: protein translocase subunit SecF [Holophagaceae bacterium]|jgi:preprotein translocase SecF subunit|nr:protein translocase subunit SecF [Holophagaceae bacterium]
MRVFHNLPHFDFMRWKGLALSVSWGIIILCLLIVRPWQEPNPRVKLGMQFVGGNDMTVRFSPPIPAERVRQSLAQAGFTDASVVPYAATRSGYQDFAVKVRARKTGDQQDSTKQSAELKEVFRKLDQEGAGSTLPSLNLEGAATLTDRLAMENPLQAQGDTEATRKVYEPLGSLVTASRASLPGGLYGDFSQLPAGLPGPVKEAITKDYRPGTIVLAKDESFSPSISGEWTAKTLKAVLWASIAILVYIMFRFTLSFAIGGIVSLIHDVLMALALFAVFGYEFNVAVVASFLTLMGYSMSDTIVVFDRIRENSRKPEYKRKTVTELVNDSINQTMSRTILTSMSVLFVSVCLWQFGGPALHDLAFPLVIGVITGTYSSIYIASPVVVYWEKWFPSKDNLKQKHA